MDPLTSPPLAPRLDLGLRGRARAWRAGFSPATLGREARAGASALGLTLPLSLLLAAQTGLPAPWLVLSSLLASAVAAVFAGSPRVLSGPGVASAAAVALLCARHGQGGLALACAGCGVLQVGAGVFGLGRLVRLVPLPVVKAFVTALGGWVLLLAAPHVLGLAAAPSAGLGALDVLDHLLAGRAGVHLPALMVAGLTCGATAAGRRFWPGWPVGLVVLALATGAVALSGLAVPRLPDLPLALSALPSPAFPSAQPVQFAGAALLLWLLASGETLLSAVAPGEGPTGRADPDQDLIGHGLANLALAFVGGVPATGAVIRSEALGRASGGGPAAGIAHALAGVPVLALLLAADRQVPMAALAGVTLAHALPLLSPGPFRAVLSAARGQAAILAATCAVMLMKDLLAGLETGLALSLLAVLLRVGRARVTVHRGVSGAPHQVTFSGPVTFLSSPRLETLHSELGSLDAGGVILDLRDVPIMDFTGARRLAAIVALVVDRGERVALLGVSPACRELLLGCDRRGLVGARLAVTEEELDGILDRPRSFELRAHVVASFGRFREEVRERFTPLYQKLAEDQRPHTLFIGCVDSRVTPALLTGTHPGELFVVRCLGAIVVPPGGPALGGEAAAIEYAVGVLGVRNIVVCGHSRCGAIAAMSRGQAPPGLDNLARWLTLASPAAGPLTGPDLDEVGRATTVRQLENLSRFPQVRAGLEQGTLRVHAWFYDVGRAELYEWQEAERTFAVLRGPDPD
jgi:carbonic anhydrase